MDARRISLECAKSGLVRKRKVWDFVKFSKKFSLDGILI